MDFLRLNHFFIPWLLGLLAVAVVYAIGVKGTKFFIEDATDQSKVRTFLRWAFGLIMALLTVIGLVSGIQQTSVNNIPRATIDRSFIKQSQDRYQIRVDTVRVK